MAHRFMSWCLLLLLAHATCVHSQDTCTVVTGESAQLDILFTTSGDKFIDASWYYRGVDGSSADAILYYELSSNFTEYYPPYDNPDKYKFAITDTTFSLIFTSASASDLGVYGTEITHDGGPFREDINVTSLLPSQLLEEFYTLVCGTRYNKSDNNIQGNCQSYSIFIPDGYNGAFSVDFNNGNSNVYNETHCGGVYPCTIVHNFTSVPDMVTISIILEGLCTEEPPIAPYVFSFSSVDIPNVIKASTYYIAEIVFAVVTLIVIILVCECVILEAGKPVDILRRNMWLVVCLAGVLVDIIVAAADIGAFYAQSDRNPDDAGIVLGVNLGLALGVSAVLLIYAGVKHMKIKGKCPGPPIQTTTKPSPKKDLRDSGGLSGPQQNAMNGKPYDESRKRLKTPSEKSRQGQLAPLGGGKADLPVQQIPTPRKLPALKSKNAVGPDDAQQDV